MPLRKVLILFKTSTFQHRFLNGTVDQQFSRIHSKYLRRFEQTHHRHYQTLKTIEAELCMAGISYKKVARGRAFDPSGYDLVLSVGGDGTFLEAARSVMQQPLLGVNSDPQWSVGRFCVATGPTFRQCLTRIQSDKFKTVPLARIKLSVSDSAKKYLILNDALICHKNPAAMSRYVIKLGRKQEEQCSSGVWVATPAGSTGAIRSAGGKRMALTQEKAQYKVRELYKTDGEQACLRAGIFSGRQHLCLTSFMKEGVIYIDGSHFRIPFAFGQRAVLALSQQPLPFVAFAKVPKLKHHD